MRVNLEIERTRLQKSREEIARDLGVTAKTYRAYVNGRAIPSDTLERMAKLFGCSVDYLLGLADDRAS